MVDLDFYIKEFGSNAAAFDSLFTNLEPEQISWKQDEKKWSLLEIASHLVDEEREDFRTRLKLVLGNPEIQFPSIDPAGWVLSRNYSQKNFSAVIEEFEDERKHSIEWLKSLHNAKWNNTHIHPTIGPMSAKFILANWLAHDYLHIRQITKLKYDYLRKLSGENLQYAGTW